MLRYAKGRRGNKGRGEPSHWLIDPDDYDKFAEDIVTLDIVLDEIRNIAAFPITKAEFSLVDHRPNGKKMGAYCWVENPENQGRPRIKYHQILHLMTTMPEDWRVTPDVSVDGTVSYLRDGTIGKAYLIVREGKGEYLIDVASENGALYVKRVATYMHEHRYQKLYERKDD